MVYFIAVLLFDRGNGNKSETSMSKIKNKIMIKKNCIEKVGITGVCDMKPHSNVFHFCNLVSLIRDTVFTNVIMTDINKIFTITHTLTVICLGTSSVKV